AEVNGDAFRMICCTTAGTSNSARAGHVSKTFSAYQCGTINTFLLIDGRTLPAAMVNALITATEAKAAALQDLHLRARDGGTATGTTSDSFVLAVSQQSFSEVHAFAGTATTIGDAAARLVYQTVYEAVSTQEHPAWRTGMVNRREG
ncbi:adenosylcobinamide amidohydrolase, partial [Microbacteriaceae bacterium K1510]|nr:adenosylcobinamide amidohydrolase [Microbacteriaceae bacterium K1510]